MTPGLRRPGGAVPQVWGPARPEQGSHRDTPPMAHGRNLQTQKEETLPVTGKRAYSLKERQEERGQSARRGGGGWEAAGGSCHRQELSPSRNAAFGREGESLRRDAGRRQARGARGGEAGAGGRRARVGGACRGGGTCWRVESARRVNARKLGSRTRGQRVEPRPGRSGSRQSLAPTGL